MAQSALPYPLLERGSERIPSQQPLYSLEVGCPPREPLPEAAKWRMGGIPKVIQPDISPPPILIHELARRNSRPGGEGVIELLTMCGYYCTVPASYQFEGIAKEGDHPQSIFQGTEFWEGGYGGGTPVLKVLRGPRVDSRMEKPTVSMLNDPPVVTLMGEIAVL